MQSHHLGCVMAIADRIHQDYPERQEVFAERLALFPQGCFVAERTSLGSEQPSFGDDTANAIVGYAVCHPGLVGLPPPLDSFLRSLPRTPDCLYLHDVALLPDVRGQGLGAVLVDHLVDLAVHHGLPAMALVAVHHSAPFWAAHGFKPFVPTTVDITKRLSDKLVSYGASAAYLLRMSAKDD